ncbi:MAG: hypothetical protein EHM55_02535 [Acidobacteria bacterium]|nr:MAG: hypothetical protein EHM55_02535 [Acidobacteriota bacterium]
MNRDQLIWIVLFAVGAAALLGRAVLTEQGMGREYIRQTVTPAGGTEFLPATYGDYVRAEQAQPGQTEYRFSRARTIGLWLAAFFTLAVFSFLYSDNPFYKVAESVLVGVSAGYWMVVGFWDVLVPNLIGRLWPSMVQAWAMPGLAGAEAQRNLWYIVPLVLGVMLLWRLAPRGTWIARWPLSFIVGTFAGLQLIGFLHGDFLAQIRNTILPLAVFEAGAFDFWASVRNLLIVGGVLCAVTYFFFSFEHKGAVGRVAKVGIWFLMITFGAAFGYTVMGRIALLAIRIEFLLDDWLWLIDPSRRRAVSMLLQGIWG